MQKGKQENGYTFVFLLIEQNNVHVVSTSIL